MGFGLQNSGGGAFSEVAASPTEGATHIDIKHGRERAQEVKGNGVFTQV